MLLVSTAVRESLANSVGKGSYRVAGQHDCVDGEVGKRCMGDVNLHVGRYASRENVHTQEKPDQQARLFR